MRKVLTDADHDREVELRPGEELELRLKENPTTGYRWSLEAPDPALLQLLEDDFALDRGGAIGAGGERIFRFRAQAPGQLTLKLRHWQAWSGESSVDRHFRLHLRVAA
ncbi:protease inhibitor I42 family protein [Calidithermus chliarophilus]|uniref:protease inhibitor I42 family protein n=1 Tax=Calidithermus chliarophilus TaxID=52023 RepID=UPI0004143F77|nr:protease inhibitor I42 family protein [Calidithermus chliarophilus]